MSIKRYFLFATLFFPYALILGHSIIPHHHREAHEIADHDHHHEEKDGGDEHEDNLPEFFSHFIHSPEIVTEVYISKTRSESFTKKEVTAFLIPFHYSIISEDIPISHHPPNRGQAYSSQFLLRSFSLRAPPAC